MTKIRVAVAAGGYSTEWEISMLSAQMVYDHLDTSLFEPYILSIRKEAWNVLVDGQSLPLDLNDFSFELNGQKMKFDVVFNAIHGDPGENGPLQGYLEARSIPHTSCDQFVSALTFNKWQCNTVLKEMGFTCAKSMYIPKHDVPSDEEIIETLGLPLFIKPNQAGSSFGVSKVKSASEIKRALDMAYEEDDFVIAESFMPGTELGVGAYQRNGEVFVLAPTEIRTDNEFFDYQAKYEGKSDEITPAEITDELTREVQKITRSVYERLNCKGIVRVDFMLVDDVPHIIEVNTVPGLSPESIVPKQVRHAQIDLGDFFTDLIESAYPFR